MASTLAPSGLRCLCCGCDDCCGTAAGDPDRAATGCPHCGAQTVGSRVILPPRADHVEGCPTADKAADAGEHVVSLKMALALGMIHDEPASGAEGPLCPWVLKDTTRAAGQPARLVVFRRLTAEEAAALDLPAAGKPNRAR